MSDKLDHQILLAVYSVLSVCPIIPVMTYAVCQQQKTATLLDITFVSFRCGSGVTESLRATMSGKIYRKKCVESIGGIKGGGPLKVE